jgi:hypothetical protein
MTGGATEASREPLLWRPAIYLGFGVGAVIGAVGHLAGLDSWALVPLGAGIGGGVGSVIAWLWSSLSRKRL